MPERTAIDDMEGLYSHVSDAYRAGLRSGRDELFRLAQIAIGQISVEQEEQVGDIATRGFHVAQSCAKAVAELKTALDERRKTV